MNILFLDQSGQLGGAELLLLDLIPRLGIKAKTVLLEEGPFRVSLEDKGIETVVVDMKKKLKGEVTKHAGLLALLKALPAVFNTASAVRHEAQGAGLIYANTPKAWLLGAITAWRLKIPLVCHLHDIISARHFSWVNRKLLVLSANLVAKAVIANSQATAEAFIKAGGRRDLVSVIPNGFVWEEFDDSKSDTVKLESLRESSSIPSDAPLVLLIGRLTPWKGQHVFIQAMAELPGVQGCIVGEALFTSEDRAYAKQLPELAKELGCSDRVHFCGFRKNVIPFIRECDVVVHCSVEPEPFGRVIVEAMLCGKPVVVAGEGGAAEIVDDTVTGKYHVPGSSSSLASAIRDLIENPVKSAIMGKAAQQVARHKYGIETVAANTRVLLLSSIQNV